RLHSRVVEDLVQVALRALLPLAKVAVLACQCPRPPHGFVPLVLAPLQQAAPWPRWPRGLPLICRFHRALSLSNDTTAPHPTGCPKVLWGLTSWRTGCIISVSHQEENQ